MNTSINVEMFHLNLSWRIIEIYNHTMYMNKQHKKMPFKQNSYIFFLFSRVDADKPMASCDY